MKYIVTFLLLLFFNHFAYSQSEMKISFNQSIHLDGVDNDTDFYITGMQVKVRLKGVEINDYLFEKPGDYYIKISHKKNKKDSCVDSYLPKDIHVIVSRVKMVFDGKNIAFSSPIRKNMPTENIRLSIPVTITTYDHQPITLITTPVNSAGIGTTIVANLLDSEKIFYEGKHTLNYSLSGSVSQNSYLMFDFIDANNAIQSIPLVIPIQD